uniref:ODF3A protein n=1 Tax=Labrus bergylta TaxID=56723 RepID=A0A3Q3E3C9_9LABR
TKSQSWSGSWRARHRTLNCFSALSTWSKTVGRTAALWHSICGGSRTGSFLEDLKKTPGPAAYKAVDPYIYMKKPPHFSMTGRNTPCDFTKKPGPGAHYPERVTNTRAKAQSFSFGLRHSEYIAPLSAQ